MMRTEGGLQKGTLRRVPRAHGKWAWEWRFINPETGKQDSKYLSGVEYPTQKAVEKHLEPFVERLNESEPRRDSIIVDPTVSDLLDSFITEEKLLEIKKRRPGERVAKKDELAFSTAISYLSLCNKIREKWGAVKLDRFKPLAFQNWLKELPLEPKSKGHLKAFIHRLFKKAKLYEMLDFHENPIGLVEVRGISKRQKKQVDLTIEQCFLIIGLLPDPYHSMAICALCMGLRIEETRRTASATSTASAQTRTAADQPSCRNVPSPAAPAHRARSRSVQTHAPGPRHATAEPRF